MPLFRTLIANLFLFACLSAHSLTLYCEDDKPLQFKNPDGTLSGMTVEVVREIQKRVGNTDPIQMVPWSRGYHLLSNEPDTLLFSTSRTRERNDLFQWIGPIAQSAYMLYAKANAPIAAKNLDEAKKINSIGVYKEDVRAQFLTQSGFTNLVHSNNNITNFKKLMQGQIDAYASSSEAIATEAKQAGYKETDVKPLLVFLSSQLYIAASKKTDPTIVAKWNHALENMKKDGTFKSIFRKYYPDLDLPGPAITKF